jgi:hypothetical protein
MTSSSSPTVAEETITSYRETPVATAASDSRVQSLLELQYQAWATIPAIAPVASEIQRSILVPSKQRARSLKYLRFRGPPTAWLRHKLS